MIHIKTPEQIKIMQHGGHILSEVLLEVMDAIRPGVTELELDQLAEKLIRQKGGESGFKRVEGYHHTICMSTNDVVVHGIPGSYEVKEGDVVGVDCGVFYKGFHTDMAETCRVSTVNNSQLTINKEQDRHSGEQSDSRISKADQSDSGPSISAGRQARMTENYEIDKFLEIGKQALDAGIKQAVLGNHVGHISKAIQDIVEKQNGYAVVRSLIGHGVGKDLHEAPEVPGYLIGKIEKTPLLKVGMTIAIEVIYNMGRKEVMIDRDGWTIRSADGSLAGLFERTVAITKDGPLMITI